MHLTIINEKCPGYCEAIVEAKNFAFGRRKPKGEVYEVDYNKLDTLPLTVL